MNSSHFITQDKSLTDALKQISGFRNEPLVLFVLDSNNRMVGTLTDGDSRRALIAGASVNDTIDTIMHRDFNYMKSEDIDDVNKIRYQKKMKMKLVPILDTEKHVVDVINLYKYQTRLPIDVVLMAGGKGERLRPLTEKTPKPLLPVGENAIIDHNIDRLISFGVKHISVTVNYLAEQLEEHFLEPRGDVQVKTIREPKFLGTIGSIRFVKEFYNDTILVMNSDIFTNINFEDFYLHFKKHNAEMSVAAIPYSVQIPYGIFQLDGSREVKGIVEKPTYDYYANAGIYLIKKSAIDNIPENIMFHSTDLMEKLIANNKKVICFPLNGTWIDIGNPQEYKRANDLVKYL